MHGTQQTISHKRIGQFSVNEIYSKASYIISTLSKPIILSQTTSVPLAWLHGEIMVHKLIFIVYFLCAYVVSMTLLLPLLATSCQIATYVATRTHGHNTHTFQCCECVCVCVLCMCLIAKM